MPEKKPTYSLSQKWFAIKRQLRPYGGVIFALTFFQVLSAIASGVVP